MGKGSMCDRAGGELGIELHREHLKEEDLKKNKAGWVQVFNFGDSFTETKYGCRVGWIKRSIIIKDIQELLLTSKRTITAYRPKDNAHRKKLYFKPMNLWDKGDTEETLSLNRISEANYQDGQIQSVETF